MTKSQAKNIPMTLERLRELLDAHGADPDRWPAGERAAAEVLIEGRAEARALVAEAARLDALLDRWPAPAASPFLAARIAALATDLPQRKPSLAERLGWWLPGPVWPQLAGLAAALLIGFTLGFSGLGANDAEAAWPDAGLYLVEWEVSL